jgi:hypothetical protein
MKSYFKYIVEWITPEKRAEAERLGQLEPIKERLKNEKKPEVPEWVATYLMQFHKKKGSSYKEILPSFKSDLQNKITFNTPTDSEGRYIITTSGYFGAPAGRFIHDDILTYLQLNHKINLSLRQFSYWNKFTVFGMGCCDFPFIAAHIKSDILYISESYSDRCADAIDKCMEDKDWKFYKVFQKLMKDTNTTYGGRK